MTKVTLLGDSIRLIGYGAEVPKLLGSGYTVWQPEENCRFSQYTLRGLFEWRKNMEGSEIIHWNNGLWDTCELFGDGVFTPLEIYTDTMVRIAKILKTRAKHIIFATTTPLRSTYAYGSNAVIDCYNAALVPLLQSMDIEINDLNARLKPDIDRYIRSSDSIHLSSDGITVCANAVAEVIRSIK